MAGLGFKASNDMANSSARKTMGIKFVKPGEKAESRLTSSFITSDSSCSHPRQGNSNPASTDTNSIPSLMSGQMKSVSQINNSANIQNKTMSTPPQAFVKSGESYSCLQTSSSRSVGDYLKSWECETNSELKRLRRLAYMVVTLKSKHPNAKDKLHSAANRVPIRIEFNTEPVFGVKNNNSFLCYVFIEGVSIASGQGAKIKDAKTNAYENAMQKILMPYLRIVPTDPTSKVLQGSKEPFTAQPPEPSKVPLKSNQSMMGKDQIKEVQSQHRESNMESACLKRRHNEYKPLDEFVIVEPIVSIRDCTAAHTLRRSADFNHMLLEYEYFFKGTAARCILKIENEVLADVNGPTKTAAKNAASVQALFKLKRLCWVIKTKQAFDSNTKISKEDMLNELNDQSGKINQDNIGNKLMRKMGWSGGGVGKDESGIVEPVFLEKVINREGLGLRASMGITDEFRKRVRELIEAYATSGNQEDLVLSCDFRLEERQIIHDECRRLNLRSKSRGKKKERYLCIRRKRSVNQLFNHLMSVGGETIRYKLVPPGNDATLHTQNSDQVTIDNSQWKSELASPKLVSREDLGMNASERVTDKLRKTVNEFIVKYVASDNQNDLEFSADFNLEEQMIIQDECRKLDLVSESQGGKEGKSLCVRRKIPKKNTSSNHGMSFVGETAHSRLAPPGVALHSENANQGTIPNSQPSSLPNKTNATFPSFIKDTSQPFNLHRSFGPDQRGNNNSRVSSGGYDGNGRSYNSQSRQALCGNSPHQSRFPSNFGNGGPSFQNSGPNFQSPGFIRAPGNKVRERPCQMDPSNRQNDMNDSCRPNGAMNNAGFPHQNNVSNMHPGYNNSFDPMSVGSNVQNWPQSHMMTSGFQQNNVNPMNQGRNGFQGNHNNTPPMTRMGFGNDMGVNRLPPRRDEDSAAPENHNHMRGSRVPIRRDEFSTAQGYDNNMGERKMSSGRDEHPRTQGFDNDMRGPRMLSGRDEHPRTQGFDNDMRGPRMLSGRDEYYTTATPRFDNDMGRPRMPVGKDPGTMHRMMNGEWDAPGSGCHSRNIHWDMGGDGRNNFAHETDMHPDQYAQRQRMHTGSFNQSMNGSFR